MPLDRGFILFFLGILVISMHYYRLRHVNDKPLWDDGFTYLRMAREIQKCRCLPSFLTYYFAGDDRGQQFTLPPLLMILLSPVAKFPYRYPIHTSFLLDIIAAASLALASRHLLNCDWCQALCAALVFLMTPYECQNMRFYYTAFLGAALLLILSHLDLRVFFHQESFGDGPECFQHGFAAPCAKNIHTDYCDCHAATGAVLLGDCRRGPLAGPICGRWWLFVGLPFNGRQIQACN